jgi:hypothetical protein
MLDQLFTAENFRKIYDVENRRGHDLVARFFPTLEPNVRDLKDKVQELRAVRSRKNSLPEAEFNRQKDLLKEQINAIKKTKSDLLDQLLEVVSKNVGAKSFQIALRMATGPGGKNIFVAEDTAETYFVLKQLQVNLQNLYAVKQSNRHDLVCQVRNILSSTFPYQVLRTDISSFYENIDRKSLIQTLEEDQLLSSSSKRHIRNVLDIYGRLAGSEKGIPRGIGISAYLAELYLRHFDRSVRSLDGLVLYCRYVDDIVAILSPSPTQSNSSTFDQEFSSILAQYGLLQNQQKTVYFDLAVTRDVKFEYLGYRFFRKNNELQLSPSSRKIKKYKSRIQKAFEAYEKTRHTSPRHAHRDLVSRIKFLTGNARLKNSKSTAVVGSYYSNSLSSHVRSFSLLDKFLVKCISHVGSPRLRSRLKKYKFLDGFEKRVFHNFSAKELKNIVEVWEHG